MSANYVGVVKRNFPRKDILKLILSTLKLSNNDISLQLGGWGGTPRKIGWGCAAHFAKPLPYS